MGSHYDKFCQNQLLTQPSWSICSTARRLPRPINIAFGKCQSSCVAQTIISSENRHKLPLRHFEDMKNGVITAQILASDGGAAGCFRSRRILLAERAQQPSVRERFVLQHSSSSSSDILGHLLLFSCKECSFCAYYVLENFQLRNLLMKLVENTSRLMAKHIICREKLT